MVLSSVPSPPASSVNLMEALSYAPAGTERVVVDPPRAGLHWDVTLRLTGSPVPRLAYLSCDPATLARDLGRMMVNYRLVAIRAFDLFPHTAHVETFARFEVVQ